MPELPEVETVKETLKKKIIGEKIISVDIYHDNIIAKPTALEFKKNIINQTIVDIKRKGKWLLFELNDYYLLSHLRMEGKYYIKDKNDEITKLQHVIFNFESGKQLRYNDTRKFGKMYLLEKDKAFNEKPLIVLGLEPWDEKLTYTYLQSSLKDKKIPIKTILLDQSIICGIGNIYADEILFQSKLNPYKPGNEVTKDELKQIIHYTKITMEKAIELGGTTVLSYTSSEGVHGRFQNELLIHTKKECPICNEKVTKVSIGGRGTYYCHKCQKKGF